MEPDMRQVRQALEKLSFIEAVNLAMALAPRLYTSWENILRAMVEAAAEAAGEEEAGLEEKTVVEEVITSQ